MTDFLSDISVDAMAAALGMLVAIWAIAATLWQVSASRQRELRALAALGVALALLAHDRRAARRETN